MGVSGEKEKFFQKVALNIIGSKYIHKSKVNILTKNFIIKSSLIYNAKIRENKYFIL
jgi:hypothetical protein